MIKSMTGFGRGEYSDGQRMVTVDIRSVNHRYCDISVRMPKKYAFAEEKIKQAVRAFVKRGKVDVSVAVDLTGESAVTVALDRSLAGQYLKALQELAMEPGVRGGISLDLLASFPDLIREVPAEEDEEEVIRALVGAAQAAAARLEEARETEGAKLAQDLLEKNSRVRALTEEIEARADQVPVDYQKKLMERIQELLKGSGVPVPEDRLAAEIAFFADKCSIAEEITRLKSHTDQLVQILEKEEPAGKKLDFLVQEMNREANTIGSKANDLTVTNLMLQLKSEIEKIREQVQNIE